MAAQKGQIVDGAPLVRRFVQALARGYEAVRADPSAAVQNMVKAVPSLKPESKALLVGVEATLPDFFPAGNHPWGWQVPSDWNKFSTWMHQVNLLTNSQARSTRRPTSCSPARASEHANVNLE